MSKKLSRGEREEPAPATKEALEPLQPLDHLIACVHGLLQEGKSTTADRNRTIILKRLRLDGESLATLEELATYYGLTRERIRQIEASFLKRLSSALRGKRGHPAVSSHDQSVAAYLEL